LLLIFFLFCEVLFSQITITRNDMPNVGDSLLYTETLPPVGIDYTETGNNYTWNFSELGVGSQNAEVYVSVSSTPLLYQAVFNWPFWNPPASIASPGDDIMFIPGVAISDYYDFFKEQNTSYARVGFGLTISDIPIPIKYNNPELLYSFPISAGSSADSSESSFSLDIPDLGYYETYRKRLNTVDGWGTLTTPLGTFQTIRMKSTLITFDSIYIDSLQTGIPVRREITEYKWLGNGFGRPLLVVSKEGFLPARAQYLAEEISPLSVDAGFDVTILQGEETELLATVTGGSSPYVFVWSNGGFGNPITVSPDTTTTYSVNVVDASFQYASDEISVYVIPAQVQQSVDLPGGWSGLSSYLIQATPSVSDILSPIENELVLIQNQEGMYYPQNAVNTLGDWDRSSGYIIKLSQNAMLQFNGFQYSQNTISLLEGWNLIPVLSNCEIELVEISDQINSEIVVVTEVADIEVFWPEKSIYTLNTLLPGKAYWIKVNADCSITFPECK